MAKENNRSRGSSVVWAEWRRGLKDLQTTVIHAFPQQHIAQHEEPGAIASPTQHEVYESKHGDQPGWNTAEYATVPTQQPSVVNASASEPHPRLVEVEYGEVQRQASQQQFNQIVGAQREAWGVRSASQREAQVDIQMSMAEATKESFTDRGIDPPQWTQMSRQKMEEAFTPPSALAQKKARETPQVRQARDLILHDAKQQKAADVMPPAKQAGAQPPGQPSQNDPLSKARERWRERALELEASNEKERGPSR